MPRINYPIQNALINSGADLITNATFELETYPFMKILKVKGEGWVKKNQDSIIETERLKKIISTIQQRVSLFTNRYLYLFFAGKYLEFN